MVLVLHCSDAIQCERELQFLPAVYRLLFTNQQLRREIPDTRKLRVMGSGY